MHQQLPRDILKVRTVFLFSLMAIAAAYLSNCCVNLCFELKTLLKLLMSFKNETSK